MPCASGRDSQYSLRPPWARMVELTRPELVGRPLAVTVCQYTDNRPYNFFDTWWARPELGGGFFHMHGVHVIDWFRAMCGDAESVIALSGPQHDARYGFPDIVHATYRFRSGALASINGGLTFPLHKFRESQGPWAECEHGGFKLVPHLDHIDLYWQRLDEQAPHHERFDDLGFDHAYRLEVGDFVRWLAVVAVGHDERAPSEKMLKQDSRSEHITACQARPSGIPPTRFAVPFPLPSQLA